MYDENVWQHARDYRAWAVDYTTKLERFAEKLEKLKRETMRRARRWRGVSSRGCGPDMRMRITVSATALAAGVLLAGCAGEAGTAFPANDAAPNGEQTAPTPDQPANNLPQFAGQCDGGSQEYQARWGEAP